MTYREKLLDPRWQKKRLEILNRDGWTCRYCGNDKQTLHVHHIHYEPGKQPWDAIPEHLVALCSDCHDEETSSSKEQYERLKKAMTMLGFTSRDFSEIASGFEDLYSNIQNGFQRNGNFSIDIADLIRDHNLATKAYCKAVEIEQDAFLIRMSAAGTTYSSVRCENV